jgi:ATP-dependent Clp protease ATP-binding subunit ClpA
MPALDGEAAEMLALWSLLLWERKVGLVALERSGVDRFELARGLDQLLEDTSDDKGVAWDSQRSALVRAKAATPFQPPDLDALLEPLLLQAEHEALALTHNYVGSEHVLLAIVRLAKPALANLLRHRGMAYDRLRQAVVDLLREP